MIRRLQDERGQALIMAALCMPLMLGFLGFALDVGLLSVEKRKVQAAADSAAIAAAAELNYGDYLTAAQTAAALNGFTNGVNGATVSVNPSGSSTPSPLYGAYAGQSGYVEVIVKQSTPTAFMSIFNISSVNVSARAVGGLGGAGNCIYALSPIGVTILLNNNAQLSAPDCGVVDDSMTSPAISVTGSASITASSVESVGGVYADNSGSKISPTASTGIAAVSDPLASLSPPSYSLLSCTLDPLTYHLNGGSTYSVGPGSTYSTTQNGNTVCYTSLTLGVNGDTVTLNPGIYVITGPLTFASGTVLGGAGVTFYLVGLGSVNIGNGANLNFSAPTSGTYDGILFYQDRTDILPAVVEGGSSSTLQGILYFPSAALLIGNGSTSTVSTPIIASSIAMVGGSKVIDQDYSAINSSSPLATPKLVE
jgi:hypothetical protein